MSAIVFKPLVYQDLIAEISVLIILCLLHFNFFFIFFFLILILYELYHFLYSYDEKIVITENMIILMNLCDINKNVKINKIELKKNSDKHQNRRRV